MERKSVKILKILSILFVAVLFVIFVVLLVMREKDIYDAVKKPYLYIDGKAISQLEYNYYYQSYRNSYMSDYSFAFDYMDVDSNKPLDEQQYDENMTFEELFAESTKIKIKEVYALNKDGKERGIDPGAQERYDDYLKQVSEVCTNNGASINDYFRKFYGEYATLKRLEPVLKDDFYASAYIDYLIEEKGSYDKAYEYISELSEGYEVTSE